MKIIQSETTFCNLIIQVIVLIVIILSNYPGLKYEGFQYKNFVKYMLSS